MYPFIDNRTLSYPETIAYWKDYLKDLNMNCIKYLEIGSLHGGSLLTFHNMFGPNVESTCIDPFSNCDYYHEYYNEHETNYEIYKANTEQLGNKNIHLKMPSYEILPLLQKDYFDVIYIDGNHNLSSILEDAVLSYRKLKSNGYLIMDDINWGGPGEANTQSTVNSFVNAYTKHKMDLIYIGENQLILKKK
jgi:predicted O-methyltransferase YrrM